ncbi:hypothetical protein ASG31_05205 [Chryseobacterium sp. Leaf404]|uniref:hypothetical protein n=1 Tax=unclassified Chryseobacterium TaxID=2593645 RepID=UPI0006F5D7CE|nr:MULTISPECIES: hypothetical protein [unclassified Chryseobacterium]KQT18132.1 hypothetical protein ASG31_05205 [Chryseobacterium sp. Leaf404]
MKTIFLICLAAGATLTGCSKEKSENSSTADTTTATVPGDTSMEQTPSDTASLNAPIQNLPKSKTDSTQIPARK